MQCLHVMFGFGVLFDTLHATSLVWKMQRAGIDREVQTLTRNLKQKKQRVSGENVGD